MEKTAAFTNEMLTVLSTLIARFEYELVEFKEANNDFDKGKLGQYVSAISNEASLRNQRYGWLIFGVRNSDRKIVGSNYRNAAGLDKLKQEIAQCTTNGLTFIDIYEIYPVIEGTRMRVIMFKIPAAVPGVPTAWNGHYYARNGESLTSLSLEKLERIRDQYRRDWSRETVANGSIEDLDPGAIQIAREKYKEKMRKPHISHDVDEMDDAAFLKHLNLLIGNEITNAAMVLLGRTRSEGKLNPAPRVMWRLYDAMGVDKDYEIFTIPFITVGDRAYAKIRNLTYRYMPNQLTLFPTETTQYNTRLLRELLNNAIAHQDYSCGSRIYLDEFDDRIQVSNAGSFIPGSIEPVLVPGYTPPFYRNALLADVMEKVNMIDTAASGIRMMFRIQQERYFPMPDFDIADPQKVSVTVFGKVLDENYSRILFNNPDYDLTTVFLIDCVQKKRPITRDAAKHLRHLKIIEGKAPNYFVSAQVAESMEQQAQYIKTKGLSDDYYKSLIIEYLRQFDQGKKRDFIALLVNKLPDFMSDEQKKTKVMNLLKTMKREGTIDTDSANKRRANWVLIK